ncbi:hypothetical protein A2U01_0025659 [Trifolium medium]|uniref:Uncharacterized protein n=1 Tax=Trifolium medium TaxID=97028 RepID=A0A392NYR1_9FABA|nr:hypothetical protein [Trifolium medium]
MNICSTEGQCVAGCVALTDWVIWNNRNNSVWNDNKETGHQLGMKSSHLWKDWKAAQRVCGAWLMIEQESHDVQWQNRVWDGSSSMLMGDSIMF